MLKVDPIWVLVPMAVASMVSDLLAENPGVLPAISRQVITKLARAILRLFGTAFVICNICFPPLSYIENKIVHIQVNRNNRLGHVNYSEKRGRADSTKSTLRLVLRSLGVQSRDQLLRCWRGGHRSGPNNIPGRKLFVVYQ